MKTDWCTGFPDFWYSYRGFKKVYIGDICRDHDISVSSNECSSTSFAKGLIKRRVLGGSMIFIVASIACWVKYPINMFRRV